MEMYLFCARMMKRVESFIRTYISNQLKQENNHEWSNTSSLRILIFHLAMLVVVKLLNQNDYKPKDVESLLKLDLTEEMLSSTLSALIALTNTYLNSHPSLSINTIAKQKEFVTYLLANVKFSV
jgi:hypothetical protein